MDLKETHREKSGDALKGSSENRQFNVITHK
jgi:hypothetical protein